MEAKVRYKVEERYFRNNMGQLHIGYVTRLLAGKKVDNMKFTMAISKATSLTPSKVNYVLMESADFMLRKLFEGSVVSVPNFGTFRLSLKSHATIKKKEAGVSAMDSISINFQPDLDIKKKLDIKNLQFKEVTNG